MSYTIVDKMHYKTPTMQKDLYWGEMVPPEMPHTVASIKGNNDPPVTSTAAVVVPHKERELVTPNLITMATIAKADIKFRKRTLMAERKKQRILAEQERQRQLQEQGQEGDVATIDMPEDEEDDDDDDDDDEEEEKQNDGENVVQVYKEENGIKLVASNAV